MTIRFSPLFPAARMAVAAIIVLGPACDVDGPNPPTLPAPTGPVTIAEKLERQWEHFEHAAEALVDHAGIRRRAVSREQWESMLLPAEAYRLTAGELEALRQTQRERIEAARTLARDRSALDLEKLRQLDQVEAFCRGLPKGGLLHVHPNGTLDRGTVKRMLEIADPRIVPDAWLEALTRPGESFHADEVAFLRTYHGPIRYAELSADDRRRLADLFHLPEGSHDFDRFAAIFRLLSLVRSAAEHFPEQLIYDDFFRRAQEHGVFYVEFTHSLGPSEATLSQWQSRAESAAAQYGVTMRLNLAFQRSRSVSRNVALLERLLRLDLPPVIAGIDLLGSEAEHPGFEAAQAIYARLRAGEAEGRPALRRTMHAAGLGGSTNIRDAMLLGADRIGHAARIAEDPVVLEYGAHKAMPIEANLTSNIRLRYADSVETHPFLDLLRLGYRVSLSTDDEGILDTDISREFALAIAHTDITYDEIRRLCFNSIETAFLEPHVKSQLLQRLHDEFEAFEQQWKLLIGNEQHSGS